MSTTALRAVIAPSSAPHRVGEAFVAILERDHPGTRWEIVNGDRAERRVTAVRSARKSRRASAERKDKQVATTA